MTPRQRVLAALNGEAVDKVPFTIYESKIPQCSVERQLRNEGLCIVNRLVPVFSSRCPGHDVETHSTSDGGRPRVRTVHTTPVGTVSEVQEPAGYTSWAIEKLFKTPEDYRVLLWIEQHTEFTPAYEHYLEAERQSGEDVIFRGGIGLTPLHQIMISWMGVETFAVEWAERRDEVLRLEAAMRENRRKVYPLLAQSPITHANYGGNEVTEVMGPPRFAEFCVPLYEECAEHFHRHGKKLGSHLDGNNRAWADLVRDSSLDYVEAFSPDPDSDMSLAQALDAWPNKIIWMNFPSSLHLRGVDAVYRAAREYVALARDTRRVIIGITEDMPEELWRPGLLAISAAINEG